jgi:hypothetical protein
VGSRDALGSGENGYQNLRKTRAQSIPGMAVGSLHWFLPPSLVRPLLLLGGDPCPPSPQQVWQGWEAG